eukprot:gene8077-13993_t
MALMLKRKGFKDITILEKRSRPGGKSFTVNYRGAPHELGTCYLSPDYEENIIALMKKYTGDNLVHLPSASIWTDKFRMPLTYQQYVGMESLRNFNTKDPLVAKAKLGQTVHKYIKIHQQLFGNYTGELMPRPTRGVMYKIRGTFMEFLKRNGLQALQPLFLASHTMQGYGHLDEIAALYGLMWNTPKLMFGLLSRMNGDKNTGLFMLKHGFQHLWETIIEKEHLHIEYDVNVDHVYRVRRGSWLCTRHHEHCQYYKFVIWTPELKQSIHKFQPLHADEQEIFSRTTVHYYSTSLVDSLNVRRGLTSIDYMFSNVLHKREHSVWAQRDSYAALRGDNGTDYQNGNYPSGDDGKKMRTTVGYQYGKTKPTRDQLKRIMESTLRRMNGKNIDIKFAIPWRYFPRFNPQDVYNGIIWDILKIQGKYGMWYSGSSVIFESVKSVVEYNELLLRKMKSTRC